MFTLAEVRARSSRTAIASNATTGRWVRRATTRRARLLLPPLERRRRERMPYAAPWAALRSELSAVRLAAMLVQGPLWVQERARWLAKYAGGTNRENMTRRNR